MAQIKTILRRLTRRLAMRMPGSTGTASRAIGAGNEARDRRDWPGAAMHYQRAVAANPSLGQIWVQLGHALKEQGDLAGGENAYRRAWAIAPDTADTALQLGHLFKLMGRRDQAVEWYGRAVTLDPTLRDGVLELTALGIERHAISALRQLPHAAQRNVSERVLWDVTALCQRDCAADPRALWALQIAVAARDAGAPIDFVAATQPTGGLRMLSASDAESLLAGEGEGTREERQIPFGARLIIAGTQPRSATETGLRLQTAMIDHGVRPLLFLPDLTPILRPEWFAPAAQQDAAAYLDTLRPLLTGAIASDDDSAQMIRTWADPSGKGTVPVFALPLAAPQPAFHSWTGRPPATSVALLPRDAAERVAMASAWRLMPRPARLRVIACDDDADPALVAGAFDGGGIEVMPMEALSDRAILQTADVLLVPASRPECDPIIANALEAGCPFIAAESVSIFARWGGVAAGYIDFKSPNALASRWGNVGCERARPVAAPNRRWGTAVADVLKEATALATNTLPMEVQIASFYDFTSATTNNGALGGRDGSLLRHGTAWGATTNAGSSHGTGSATLRFRLSDALITSYICRLLHYNTGPDQCWVRLTVNTGGTTAVEVPPRKHAWSRIEIPAPADRTAIDVAVNLESSPHASATGGSFGATLVGLFTYPHDEDRYWFEFMDQASRGRFPTLRRLRR